MLSSLSVLFILPLDYSRLSKKQMEFLLTFLMRLVCKFLFVIAHCFCPIESSVVAFVGGFQCQAYCYKFCINYPICLRN
jgi:hypothetical protein